ncbi:hypothetical protein [Neoroseomonas soli]|uniref:Uncharacterized protein n=1 Tax=Neoroseomonas soli TaxID=1081025 RepID=A0A9X9WX14_9PROT|nr:hypothetical protein [Neoroseomonas soli]MBR0671693.1 hypothetical protein [Neoroseomonas soli]
MTGQFPQVDLVNDAGPAPPPRFVQLRFMEDEAPARSYVNDSVETEAHDVIPANGAPEESFRDTIARTAFDNVAKFQARSPEDRIAGEMDLPHARPRRQVSAATPESRGRAPFGAVAVAAA